MNERVDETNAKVKYKIIDFYINKREGFIHAVRGPRVASQRLYKTYIQTKL
jgi:hypothetical protein